MYELPLYPDARRGIPSATAIGAGASHFGIPLHEHTAFVLACGLLHDDIDDRHDTIRGGLEIDPLLAAWAVNVAAQQDIQLTSFDLAVRWLTDSIHRVISNPEDIVTSKPMPVAARAAWRAITVQAIATGRLAQRKARESKLPNAQAAFWLATLCSTKAQLDSWRQLNGHSPLCSFAIMWPEWLNEFESEANTEHANNKNGIAATVGRALQAIELAKGRSPLDDFVSQEEQALWFRPYPEFRSLVPLLLKKLKRLIDLEEKFAETLQIEKLASLQQLAYGASHEINNPLANISTRAQTLVYNEHDADRRKKLLAINQQAFRAYEMIADLMLFAKPPQLELSEVPIQVILTQIRKELAEEFVEDDIQINISISERADGEPLTCWADRVQIAAAIKAICVNGIESMSSSGELTVEASANNKGESVEIVIEDSGAGLSESARRHLFDPFFSGREAGRGLGFGLSKAWRIVQLHHGRIEVSSQRNRGSRFTVVLPRSFRQLDGTAGTSPKIVSHPKSNEQTSANASVSR